MSIFAIKVSHINLYDFESILNQAKRFYVTEEHAVPESRGMSYCFILCLIQVRGVGGLRVP